MSDKIVAYLCETQYHGDWNEFLSRDHPDEIFDHVPYRNVRALVEADEHE